MESWEFQSHSLINIAQNNSELSQCQQCLDIQQTIGVSLTENQNILECLYKKCNGIMGVPITYLDKYCPEQFKIIGQMANTNIDDYNFGYPFINKERKYARILIQKKEKGR